MFKARGIAIIDYELPNGFIDAAEEQQRLKDAISNLVKGNPRVVFSDVDIRERREHRHHNGNPNIKKMKIRVS